MVVKKILRPNMSFTGEEFACRVVYLDSASGVHSVESNGFDNTQKRVCSIPDVFSVSPSFKSMQSRLSGLENKLDDVKTDLHRLSGVAKTETVLERILSNVSEVANKMKILEKKLNDLADIDRKLSTVENKVNTLAVANLSAFDDKLNEIQTKIRSLSDVDGKQTELLSKVSDMEANQNAVLDIWKANSCNSLRHLQIRPCIPARHIVTRPGGTRVMCDTETSGGGWTVFQRRTDGGEDFYRSWQEYKNGFGDLEGDFWLGLENLHSLVETGDFELRVDMKYKGREYFAEYSHFEVSPESDNYRLTISGFSGTAGNSLAYHDGMAFTTHDRDNDKSPKGNCASFYTSAWWYRHCHRANMNGLWGDHEIKGLKWEALTGEDTVTFSEMKVRPKN